MKILSPTIHGFIDYAVVLLFAVAPDVFGFGGSAQVACYAIACTHFLMTLFTAFPLGLAKVIPFTVHGGIEAVSVFALVGLPWLLGFSEIPAARNFFLASAGALAVTWLVTNYKAADHPYLHTPRHSHA